MLIISLGWSYNIVSVTAASSFAAFMQNTEIINLSHAVDCERSVLIEILGVVCQISAEIPLD